jgi:putative endonuclease
MEDWYVYIIKNKNKTYCGATPDPEKRIKKHNGLIPGGAKYTKAQGQGWEFVCIIGTFDKINALRFEWAVKHVKKPKYRGITSRMNNLYLVLTKDRWTSKSPEADECPLCIEWHDKQYKIKSPLPYYIFQ